MLQKTNKKAKTNNCTSLALQVCSDSRSAPMPRSTCPGCSHIRFQMQLATSEEDIVEKSLTISLAAMEVL